MNSLAWLHLDAQRDIAPAGRFTADDYAVLTPAIQTAMAKTGLGLGGEPGPS